MNHTALAVHTAVIAALLLTALALPSAAVITVNWNGTGDHTTIWAAVGAAVDGDTVLVAQGTYSGAQNTGVYFSGKNIDFRSEDGEEVTIIDGDGQFHAFTIADALQDSTTAVRGFTFLNCWTSGGGGALAISNSAPIVEDCVFEGCAAEGNGGAIAFSSSSATVRDCVFRANSTLGYRGGAIFSYNSNVTVSRCLFDENIGAPTYRGGAVYMHYTSDIYTNCTFTESQYDAVVVNYSPGFRMMNCIVAGTVDGVGVADAEADGTEISHCVVFGNANGDSLADHYHDNLFVDPLFCDPPGDDYTHCSDSPCLPGVNVWGETVGLGIDGCNPCDVPVEGASWGGIKALFR
ncbi:MAG: right-handed parallel beta-helix repeat-containing protein [Candidatus Eisenbacteria bacterium]